MKKTLITLAALAMASVASADGFSASTHSSQSWYSGNYVGWLDSFSFTFKIADDADLSAATLASVSAGYTGTDAWNQIVLTLSGSDGTYTFGLGRGKANGTTETSATISGLTSGVVYTLNYANSAASISSDSGSVGATGTIDTQIVMTSAYATAGTALVTYFNSDFSATAVTPGTPDTPPVPEPTTATLSLLALAGLAARRRRK